MSQNSRRAFLKKGLFGLAALPFGMGALTSQAFAQALPPLSEDAPQAKALNYVKVAADASNHPKFQAGQYCDNCMFWRPANNGCALFPQNSVEAKGWCQSWVKKPG
ncbi:high-potential iron-sulfur protein [Marinospirillum alkaliphilum]|uniref:High-potential iron-sulfur protein n=1 Tax=Marinospirillum alkaliphilum DSM 21637 TaxID=1122209 RepID=A0A1K1WA73_9GAMM|nr:high-potential iron-sulfur protein [Marinospirillum alkaliphilum]SFX34079.1 High potential iron-sulfur protein [Marinospirillum alkaliphilum DSM 21637]